ncbi:MAG: hypothetical protein RLZZ373_2668 [Pseudomonadota bacterium]|jgi:hypothetical protein
MPSLTTCLGRAGALLTPDDHRVITQATEALRASGVSAADAAKQAVAKHVETLGASHAGLEESLRTSTRPATAADVEKTTEAAKAQSEALVPDHAARIEQLKIERPDQLVTLPGYDEPMRLADALRAADEQHALDVSDVGLIQAATQCALAAGAAFAG